MYREILPEKKVIRASAGTGKTYRLSLEFISLLLKYRGYTSYDEILVLTFTKKATAEIRQRIFSQMKEIISDSEEGKSLVRSITGFCPELVIDIEQISYLKKIYFEMLSNKDKLRVSTIDSFTNTIFNGLIAPYYNISDPQIDPKINEKYMPELFEELLKPEHLQYFEEIFSAKAYRDIDEYQKFIDSIIENRWMFNFIDETDAISGSEIDEKFNNYAESAVGFIEEFINYLAKFLSEKSKSVDWNKFIMTSYKLLICEQNSNDLDLASMKNYLISLFTNKKAVVDNYQIFLSPKFWSGSALFRGKTYTEQNEIMQEKCDQLAKLLADFLYAELVQLEQMQIRYLANVVLKKYDEIKYKQSIFTYSDITYFTYRYLYDPELSVVDGKNLLNLFYEQLSYKTRYILIDEFQDTSILQWNILNPMIKEAISGVGQNGSGGAIIVGDEKQSIYGWRGGERKLLVQASNLISLQNEPETLNRSYRSKKIIIDNINRLFLNDSLHQHLKDFQADWHYPMVDTADKDETGFFQVNLFNIGEIPDEQQKLTNEDYFSKILLEEIIPKLRSGEINPERTAILARKNDYMQLIARILDENGIDYLLESSASLLQHRTIKPIIWLLNFLVYQDPYELIKFLRSNLVLVDGIELKQILDSMKKCFEQRVDWQNFFVQYKENSAINLISELSRKKMLIPELIKQIVEDFSIIQIYSSELDIKNLHRFIEMSLGFAKQSGEYCSDLSGFCQYCKAVEEKEEFTQLGLSDTKALKLMTIHKSKGLEFETVFAFIDADSKKGNSERGLKILSRYDSEFSRFEDWAYSYQYHKIMDLAKPELAEADEIREATEELNGIYVQLTRAANNLFIYDKLSVSKKCVDKICSEPMKKLSVPKQLFCSIYEEFSSEMKAVTPYHLQYEAGELICKTVVEEDKEFSKNPPGYYFGMIDFEQLEALEDNDSINPEAILRGNIVHNYLAEIIFDSSEARIIARKKIFTMMGTLLTETKFDKCIKLAERLLDKYPDYFSNKFWDKAFNERIVFDQKGREKRIDRMVINEQKREILIIDYKTGEHYEQEQIDEYKRIISSLDFVKAQNYKVKAIFLEVK